MSVQSSFGFLLIALLSTCLQAEENWPQLLGPAGNGVSEAKNLPLDWSETENIRWKTPIPGRGWSSPVVWKEQVWFTTAASDGKQMSVLCLNAATGKIERDILLIENENPRFCHSLNSYASCTPVIEEGRVYVHFGSYGTACLDTKTAEVLWERRDLPCDHFRGPGSSPILFEDLLIVHYDGFDLQYVVALEKASGKTVWKTEREVDYGTDNGDIMKAYCTPIVIDIAGQQQLISPTSKATIAYDPRTGKEIWRVRYPGFSATARPLYENGVLYLNTGFSKAELYAVKTGGKGDVTDSHVLWVASKSIGSKPSSLLVDGLLYVLHDGGVISCLAAKSGEIVWSKRLGGNYSSSPIYGAGRIYVSSHEGKTTVLKAGREFEQLAENELEDGFMATPAVVEGDLLLRTRSAIYRVGKP